MKKLLIMIMVLTVAIPVFGTKDIANAYDENGPFRYDFSCPDANNVGSNTGLTEALNKGLLVNFNIPMCTLIGIGKNERKLYLNGALLTSRNITVYGTPQDVPDNDTKQVRIYRHENDIPSRVPTDFDKVGKVTTQWRYSGYVAGGSTYSNELFTADSLVTTEMSKRNWINEPWDRNVTNSIRNSHKPVQPAWRFDYDPKVLIDQLESIIDPYRGTNINRVGDWKNLDRNSTKSYAEEIFDFVVWSQPAMPLAQGFVTGWHKGSSQDWYDSFAISQTDPGTGPVLGDIAVDPAYAELVRGQDGKAYIKFNVWSNFEEDIAGMTIAYRWSKDKDGNTVLGNQSYTCIMPDTFGNGNLQNDKIFRNMFTSQIDKARAVHGAYGLTVAYLPIPSITAGTFVAGTKPINTGKCEVGSAIAMSKGANKVSVLATDPIYDLLNNVDLNKFILLNPFFVINANPGGVLPKEDVYLANNRAVFSLSGMKLPPGSIIVADPIVTPPIKFKNITPYESIAYWTDAGSTLDRYELKCSPSYAIKYSGTLIEHGLSGLTPSTAYTCRLEAFDTLGVSGGVTSGSFTTLAVAAPSGSGYWDDRGIIRELGSKKQSHSSIPKNAIDYSQYSATQVKQVATQFSPYFGEKIGAYGDPVNKTQTYSWNFNYDDEVWDSCDIMVPDLSGPPGAKKCQGGWDTVTYSATNSCIVEYAAIGPSGWGSITSDPTGMTMAITNDWNSDTATLRVSSASSKSCVGADTRDSGRNKFTYYVPTTYTSTSNSIILDTGFDSTTNKIESEYQNLNVYISANAYSLGADGRSLSGSRTSTPIPFKQMWSIYTALGAGN